MLFCIENLIDETALNDLRHWLASATFEDGRVTAGGSARKVKYNEQVRDFPDPKTGQMQERLTALLEKHPLFTAAAMPQCIHPPLFSRYSPGMQYGTHMDSALMGGMRVDLSLTLFLSAPSTYDGGELVIDFSTGPRAIKLAAGSGVLYATTAPHRVETVTRGQRLAAVTWIRSLVRDPAAREILLDLKTASDFLSQDLGKTTAISLIDKSYINLRRRWIED